jgi:uncharacterized protein
MKDNRNAEYYCRNLELLPHPEGGFYKEVYRCENTFNVNGKERACSTAIYFLIEKNNFSAFHRIKSDELWHFYAGDALEVIEIHSDGKLRVTAVGSCIGKNEKLLHVVPAGTWFASRVKQGGEFSLAGCTVSPGFDFEDFEMGSREELIRSFPEHSQLIVELSR